MEQNRHEYKNSEVIEIVNEYIHSQRDRGIMIRRLVDMATLEQLAEEFDMSVSQIKRIVYRNAEIVFRHIPPK